MKRLELSHTIFDDVDMERVEAAKTMAATFTKAALMTWAQERTVVQEIGGQRFRMLVDHGDDQDGAIVVGGEYGNGLDAIGGIARARIVREFVDPAVSLILQPNTSLGQPNTNFSKNERRAVRQGSASPLVDRIRMTLEQSGNPERMIAYGPSQGGVTMLALGAHPSLPPVAVAVMGTPNVVNRSCAGIAKDFVGVGADLRENTQANFEAGDVLGGELIADLSIRGLAKYGIGLTLPDNRALLGIVRRATASDQMRAIIERSGSVVHAWATGDNVSPAHANSAIASELSMAFPRQYAAYSFEGDHSVTNMYLSNAALVACAQKLICA